MDPLPKRRKSKTSSSTDAPLRFLLVVLLLATLGLASFYTWTQGFPILKKLSKSYNPHSAQHASHKGVLRENEIVHSLYGSKKEGGIERFDLVASIFVMDRNSQRRGDRRPSRMGNDTLEAGKVTPTLSARRISVSISSKVTSSDVRMGKAGGRSPPKQPQWERVWSEVVMRDLEVGTASRQVVVEAVLPGRVM